MIDQKLNETMHENEAFAASWHLLQTEVRVFADNFIFNTSNPWVCIIFCIVEMLRYHWATRLGGHSTRKFTARFVLPKRGGICMQNGWSIGDWRRLQRQIARIFQILFSQNGWRCHRSCSRTGMYCRSILKRRSNQWRIPFFRFQYSCWPSLFLVICTRLFDEFPAIRPTAAGTHHHHKHLKSWSRLILNLK